MSVLSDSLHRHGPDSISLPRRSLATAAILVLAAGVMVPAAVPASAADESITEHLMLDLWSNDYSGTWDIGFGHDNWAPPEPSWQLRVPSFQTRVVPESDNFAWLGEAGGLRWHTQSEADYDSSKRNHAMFRIHTFEQFPDMFAEDAQHVTFSFSNVQGPGTFALYNVPRSREADVRGPDAPNGLFRWGTGTQRDGTPQSMEGGFDAPLNQAFGVELSFEASGMYCVDATSSAILADGSQVSATRMLRFAVGDEVAADAPCGAASNEVPGSVSEPEPPDPTDPPDPEPKPDEVQVIGQGHIDAIAPQVDFNDLGQPLLKLRAHHDDLGWLDWDEFVLYSDDKAKVTLPESFTKNDDWSFVGEPGQTIWRSPRDQLAGLPWVGLSAEHSSLRENVASGEAINVRIDPVTGSFGNEAPGDLIIHEDNAQTNGLAVVASTKAGLPSGYGVTMGVHVHYYWDFTAPGVYCIPVTVDTVLADGNRYNVQNLLTHVVGEAIDPATVEPCATNTTYPESGAKQSVEPANPDALLVVEKGVGTITLDLDGESLQAKLLHTDSKRASLPVQHDLDNTIFRAKLEQFEWGNDGVYVFGTKRGSYAERDFNTVLTWDTFGVPRNAVIGEIDWRVSAIRGPGELIVREEHPGAVDLFDTTQGLMETLLPAQIERDTTEWKVTAPGRYCIDLTWAANTHEYGQVEVEKTITVVADGEGFTHDSTTLTQTCADGAEPTGPSGNGPVPGPDEPNDRPWDLANWSLTASGARILNKGHVDVASVVEDGRLVTKIKDTTEEGVNAGRDNGWVSWHSTDEVVLQLLPESKRSIPDRTDFQFLGDPGGPVWSVLDTQEHSLLWPGWSTEHIARDVTPGGVEWRLTGKRGPGNFFIYQSGMDGPKVHFNTADGIDGTDTFTIPERSHVHGSWAFTEQGTYCLGFERAAMIDGEKRTDPFTLAVAVGETDPTKIDPADCASTDPQPDPKDAVPAPGKDGNVLFAKDWVASIAEFATTIAATDQVIAGDWDGDGVDTLVLRNGNEYSFQVTNRPDAGKVTSVLGEVGDAVVVGDFNGDGKDDLALRTDGTNEFAIYYGNAGTFANTPDATIYYGKPTDTALAGDWDGDGKATLGIQRGNGFYLRDSLSGGVADVNFTYGRAGDVPLTGDFNGDGKDSIAVTRGYQVFAKNAFTGGAADIALGFGRSTDARIVGDFFGTGTDTLAVVR